MPGEPKNKQNNIPIEVLQQLNKKRVADSRLFFDWIFHRSQAIQAEINQNMRPVIVYQTQRAYQTFVDQYGRPRTFLVQQSVPVYVQRPQNQMTHPEIYGPSNAFKTMFVQNSKELKNEFGKDKLWELTFDQKDMWFASNTDSPQMKTLKNSIRSFSFYLNRPKHDRTTNPLQFENERLQLEESILSIKEQCNNYLKTHEGRRWTPTGKARKAMVENALKLVEEYENLVKVDVEDLAEGQQLKERVQYTVEHPMNLAQNNKSLGINKGLRKITDVSKVVKPIDTSLIEFSNTKEFKEIEDLIKSKPELQKNPQQQPLFDLVGDMKWVSAISPEKRLDGFTRILADKDNLKYETENSCYDFGVSRVYADINEYINKNLKDLANPDSLASKLIQARDKYFSMGNLAIPSDTKAKFIDATGRPNQNGMYDENTFNGDEDFLFSANMFRDANRASYNDSVEMQNLSTEPLFPKEPHPSDIKQGLVGNCYFLAYFSKLVHDNPQAIKDMLKDNGDGTVTCRFFNDDNEPVFVKVNKTVPHTFYTDAQGVRRVRPTNNENSPLWVHMVEKAYMMSGIRPITNNIRKDYEEKYAQLNNVKSNVDPNRMHPTQVELALFNKRFPNMPYNQQMFDRTIQHGYLSFGGGIASILGRRVTGNKSYVLGIKKYTKPEVANMLKEHNTEQMNRLFGKLNPEFTKEPFIKYYLPKVLKHASDTLNKDVSENFGFHTANPESKNTYTSVTLGQVGKSIESFLNTDEFKQCTPDYKRGIKYITDTLVKSLKEHQKNNDGNSSILPDNESGPNHYSNYDNKLFEKLSKSLDSNQPVSMTLAGHEFSVLGYKEENGKKSLVCRNPWGFIGLDQSGVKYTPIDKRDVHNISKSDTGGIFEIEINEISAKSESLSYGESTKALSRDDMKTVVTKQIIETYVKEQPKNKQAKFRQHLMRKSIFEKTKSSKLVDDLSSLYMSTAAVRLHVEQGGSIPDHMFYRDIKSLSGNDVFVGNGPKVINNDSIRTADNSLDDKTMMIANNDLIGGNLNHLKEFEEGAKVELSARASGNYGPVL